MERVGGTQKTSIHFKELDNGRILVHPGYFFLLNFESSTFPKACDARLASLRKRKYYAQKFLHQDDPGNCHNHPDHHHLSDWMVVEVMHLPSDRHSRFLASLLIERTSGRQKAKCICDNFKTYFSAQKIFDIVKCHICCIFF